MNLSIFGAANFRAPIRQRMPAHELALVELLRDDAPAADDDAFSRCGWFDSSLELAAGLQVTEFVDLLPVDLPLRLA